MKKHSTFRHVSGALGLGLIGSFCLGSQAKAGLIIDQDIIYYSGSLATSSTETSSRLLGGLSVGASIPNHFEVGWNINYISRSDGTSSTTTTLSGTEMGPRFGMFLGKSESFSIAFIYHALASGSYTASGTSQSWQGSGFQGEMAYLPQVGKHLFAGFKVIYDSVSYSKSTDTSNITSSVTYTHSTLIPTISLSWRF